MWHDWVITRSRIHHNVRETRALRFHCVPSLTSAVKHNYHLIVNDYTAAEVRSYSKCKPQKGTEGIDASTSYVPSCLSEVRLIRGLGTPEPARESRLADRAALAWGRISSRPAVAADIVVALCITEDIATRARLELRPAALENPVGRGRGRRSFRGCGLRCSGAMTAGLCHARSEK